MEVYQGKLDFIAVCFAKDDRSTAETLIEKLHAKRLRVWSSERGCNVKKEKAVVLLFLGGADLVGRDDLNAMVSRSVRMIDYAPDNDADCMAELLGLECIQDCAMPESEEPDLKKTGIWDILNREI